MKNLYRSFLNMFLVLLFLPIILFFSKTYADPLIVDHTCTDITQIPQYAIDQAKADLHIAYGHSSHGSQLTTGMSGLVGFANSGGLGLALPTDIFSWNEGGTGGALDIDDYFQAGDLGDPDRVTWAQRTRDYLNNLANSDVNVVIWSWCGQVDATEAEINQYLNLMNQLEIDFPDVTFVYMTGHANGSGENGNVHIRNQQIRNYCIAHDKVLYDFYDIECYNPENDYFGDKLVNDNCDYDSDGNGSRDTNWAIAWQNTHTEDVDWYDCSAAHSQALNGNRKAYAAWWLWASLAGWNYINGNDVDDDNDGYTEYQGDCNDADLNVNPGMTEIPYNGINDDCDPTTLDDDIDNDGYVAANDCNDDDATIHPGAAEICEDGIDQDCNNTDLSCNGIVDNEEIIQTSVGCVLEVLSADIL